jgi:hypothetical protein
MIPLRITRAHFRPDPEAHMRTGGQFELEFTSLVSLAAWLNQKEESVLLVPEGLK